MTCITKIGNYVVANFTPEESTRQSKFTLAPKYEMFIVISIETFIMKRTFLQLP
jgi:hypothetical protein